MIRTGIEQGGGAQHRNQNPGGALVSPRVPTVRNVYRDNTYASVAIAQVQDQEWKTVWSFEFASSKIQEVTLG